MVQSRQGGLLLLGLREGGDAFRFRGGSRAARALRAEGREASGFEEPQTP